VSFVVFVSGPSAFPNSYDAVARGSAASLPNFLHPCYRRAGKLHQLGMFVRKGMTVAVSAFINILFSALAFWMGDHRSGHWWETLLLLCLQVFAGVRIVGDRAHWWTRDVAMAFSNIGISAMFVGLWGLCFLVFSSLFANYELTVWYSFMAWVMMNPCIVFLIFHLSYQKPDLEENKDWSNQV
jgi:hypothetical protein